MNNLRMVACGVLSPTCVSVHVSPELGRGGDWELRQYADVDAPVVVVDELESTIDYEEDMLDREYWARGGW